MILRKAKLTAQQERLWRVFVFLARLLALSVPVYIIISFADLSPLQAFTTGMLAWVMEGMGYSVSVQGFLLTVGTGMAQPLVFFISADCTAWKSMLFFAALAVAVPGISWRKRGMGMLAALPVIWAVNLFRIIVSVHAINSYGMEFGMFLHDVLWQIGLAALVLVLWAAWLQAAKNK